MYIMTIIRDQPYPHNSIAVEPLTVTLYLVARVRSSKGYVVETVTQIPLLLDVVGQTA